MPKRVQLPNGRWVILPDMDPYLQQFAGSSLASEEKKKGSLAGSALEGIKSIPSGVADIFYSGLQSSLGVATPFADLPVEKRLRKAASRRARERDPAYQDAFLPAVGTGIGQVAGLSAISRLPYGWQAAMGAGVAMGISDQTRRIADYEQKTGINVPWYKESMAHLAGAAIGLSEVLPIKFGMFPGSVSTMMKRMKGGVTPNALARMSKLEETLGLGAAASMAMQEATQEASAQWLQAVSARGLYDPDAMQDIARSMAEDFKVGGAVGGLVKLAQHQILGAKNRRGSYEEAAAGALRDSTGRNYALVRGLHENIVGITKDLPDILTNPDVGLDPKLARDINSIFASRWSAIPYGMDTMLQAGRVRRADVQLLARDLQGRTNAAKSEMDALIKRDPASRQKYEKAKTALDAMTADRLKKLGRTVAELRGGLGEMGGLTGNEQYENARQADLEAEGDSYVVGIHNDRRDVKLGKKGILPSFKKAIDSLTGGSFGLSGRYQMAEALGVHGGPGTEQIKIGSSPDLGLSDLGLASSDRGNFDVVELGGVIFGGRGAHKKSTDQRKIDDSDVMDSLVFPDTTAGTQLIGLRENLEALKKRAEYLDGESDKLYGQHPFARESAEIRNKKKYADDESWVRARNQNQEMLFDKTQKINADISQVNRERGEIYLRLLNERLGLSQKHFAIPANRDDKAKAIRRVMGKSPNSSLTKGDEGRFDAWFTETIASVNQSQINGQSMAQRAEKKRVEFEAGLAAETDVSDNTKAALTVQFRSQNAASFNTQPRDISAQQFIRIANLFGGNSQVAKGNAQTALAMKAIKDITRWQVDDTLYDVTADGLPSLNESTPVVKEFVNKLSGAVTDKKTGKVRLEDGRPEWISDEDIVKLLSSKNIYLRDGIRIGTSLAKQTGVGVKSRPFEKLLFDMTGAPKWASATYDQRLLMYSRLLQLPAHFTVQATPEEQSFLEKKGQKKFFRPLFLPDFYNNANIDSHIDFMTDRIADITEQGEFEFPSLGVSTLRNETKAELGGTFSVESFDEALARLIETGVFRPTNSPAPEVVLSPDTLVPPVQAPKEFPTERSDLVRLLNNYGVEGKKPKFPWGFGEATLPKAAPKKAVKKKASPLSMFTARATEILESFEPSVAPVTTQGMSILVQGALTNDRARIRLYGSRSRDLADTGDHPGLLGRVARDRFLHAQVMAERGDLESARDSFEYAAQDLRAAEHFKVKNYGNASDFDQEIAMAWGAYMSASGATRTLKADPLPTDTNVSVEERLRVRWAPVIKNIFPEVTADTDVEFVKADDQQLRTRNDDGSEGVLGIALYKQKSDKIFINNDRVQKLARLAMAKGGISIKDRQELGLANSNKYLNFVKTIEKEFYDADEVMLFVIAHELAHVKYPPQEAGVTIRLDPDAEGEANVKIAMKFADGSMGMSMREGLEGKSTLELIEEGIRTGTSRLLSRQTANEVVSSKATEIELQTELREAQEERAANIEAQNKILDDAGIPRTKYVDSVMAGNQDTAYPEVMEQMSIVNEKIKESSERIAVANAALGVRSMSFDQYKPNKFPANVGDTVDFYGTIIPDAIIPTATYPEAAALSRGRGFTHPAEAGSGGPPTEESAASQRRVRIKKAGDRIRKRAKAEKEAKLKPIEKVIRVRVTKTWTKLTDIDPDYWSEIEGWDTEAYRKLAKQDYWQFEYEVVQPDTGEAYAAYENQINQMGLAEVDRYMKERLTPLYEKRQLEETAKETERPPEVVSNSRVRFNVEYSPLEAPWAPTGEAMTQPGDARLENKKSWVGESKPQLVNRLLTDPDAKWAGQVDELWARYNETNTGEPISREDYVKKYTALITSVTPLQELSDLGILDTVAGAVTRGEMAPTESLLELGTAEGRSLVQSLMKAGALPSSLQDNVHAMRRRFIDTMETRFDKLGRSVQEVVASLRLPDNVQIQYVDAVDGMYQFLSDVAIGGKRMEDVGALYDAPGNRIIINLAKVDPNNMASALEVVKDAAFHEGLHALIMRDHLLDEELMVLRNFVRNQQNIVPKEVDQDAHDAKVTWFERAIAQHKDSELTEGDIENEAIVSLLQNMVRNPDAYVAGKKTRKIGNDLKGFLEKFVGAAKDADIVDVMKILSRIERGEVGERGSGYGFLEGEEYTTASIIRSNRLARYADPKEITELKKALVLRDAATSSQMKQREQAKVDAIADRITSRRDIIQGSAGRIPDVATNIDNERMRDEDINATARGSVPLLGLRHGRKDPEAYKLALNTFMEMRNKDPEYAYKMPAEYQTLFNNKTVAGQGAQRIAQEWKDSGYITPIDKDATRKGVEKLSKLDDKTGDTVEDTQQNIRTTTENLRYQYLDRRQWVVKQTDRLLAAQNRAELDAETSALVMWRNSDNALNWLPGLMLRGPLSYLGTSVGSGRFENAPVYDNDLAEKYGGDGQIKGLNEIFAPIIDSGDQEIATIYGVSKRILWTKKRRDELRLSTGVYDADGKVTDYRSRLDLPAATKLKLEKFEAAYVAINENNNISEDELNKTIREIESDESNKHIIEFWDRYNAYDNHMIKMSYNTGMITREVRDEWLSMPYAPFYRDVATEEDFPIGSEKEIAKRGKNLVEKALQGSTAPIKTSLADGVIQNTQALVRDSMLNAAVSRTVRDAVSLGTAEKVQISALKGVLDNRIVRVMEEGVPVFYRLDDAQLAMSTMLMGFNPKKQLQQWFGEHKLGELAQKALTGSSGLLRESVTRTPAFTIKNVFRDSWTAMTLTGGGPRLVLQAFKNAFTPDVLRRADEAGLSIGIDFVAERGKYGHQMQKELDKANLDWKKPLTPVAALWNFTGRIAKQSEVATRLAVYDRILAMTGDKALAQYYAIEIMNYGRRGASETLSTYMATVPFMNGRLQGGDVIYRGLRSKKGSSDIPGIAGYGLTADQYEDLSMFEKSRGRIINRGLILTAATAALYFLLRDDEEWQDLRDETKSDNWVLPLSDHAWLKIPIPFEIGVLFKVIPEKMLEAIMEEDVGAVDVGEETIRQLRTSLSMGGPQLLTPVVNAMRNYDTFRKDDIVDHWMETLDPNEQRNEYTSNVARGIADLANSIPLVNSLDFLTSPMKVEYMMRQYGGTMGGYVTTVADRIARTGPLMDESVVGTNKDFDFRSLVGGEGVANVPILGDLLTDPRTRGGSQQDFFNSLEELDQVIATLSSITDRDHKKGFAYAEKHKNILKHKAELRSIQKQLKAWRERREHLRKIPRGSMSDDQKREYYQRLLASRQHIVRNVKTLMVSIKQG